MKGEEMVLSDCVVPAIASALKKSDGSEPAVGIVLGSGLGKLTTHIESPVEIPYESIPGFPRTTVAGHKGRMILGRIADKKVVVMDGRFHYYEGHSASVTALPARLMAAMGVSVIMLSNAAGGINPDFTPGDIMMIKDHISFIPNPLIGPNDDTLGPRFPSLTDAYSPRLRAVAAASASKLGIALKEGVYVAVTGPSYETSAEVRFYRTIGGDAVGMSTTPEVIAARHQGVEVFAASLITNVNTPDAPKGPSHEEVLEVGNASAEKLSLLFANMIASL